jgi:phosphinothricin acetyltransferase
MENRTDIFFRPMTDSDWKSVAGIYRQGIETGNATFEMLLPEWEHWNASHLKSCRIVAEMEGVIIGWAALSPVSARSVYAGIAEVSVYVLNEFKGRKIGFQLLERLISESESCGIWTLQASIFPENTASLCIHSLLGFREMGYRERIAKMKGVWRNTILMERRSRICGND